jgi:hypothetical protein
VSNSNYDTYYCDYAYVIASCLANAGSDWDGGSNAGAFYLYVDASVSFKTTHIGARLMFL